MDIYSRGELVRLINECSVENKPVKSRAGTKIVASIVHGSSFDRFYRIMWGEISDKANNRHLWYDDNVEEVFLNKTSKGGWQTKREIQSYLSEERGSIRLDSFEELHSGKIMGGKTSDINILAHCSDSCRSHEDLLEVLRVLASGKTVLFISTKMNEAEISERLSSVLTKLKDEGCSNGIEGLTEQALESKLTVKCNRLIDMNYIIDVIRDASMNQKLDLVVIDHLSVSSETHEDMVNICEVLECEASHSDCKVIVNVCKMI